MSARISGGQALCGGWRAGRERGARLLAQALEWSTSAALCYLKCFLQSYHSEAGRRRKHRPVSRRSCRRNRPVATAKATAGGHPQRLGRVSELIDGFARDGPIAVATHGKTPPS